MITDSFVKTIAYLAFTFSLRTNLLVHPTSRNTGLALLQPDLTLRATRTEFSEFLVACYTFTVLMRISFTIGRASFSHKASSLIFIEPFFTDTFTESIIIAILGAARFTFTFTKISFPHKPIIANTRFKGILVAIRWTGYLFANWYTQLSKISCISLNADTHIPVVCFKTGANRACLGVHQGNLIDKLRGFEDIFLELQHKLNAVT